MSSATSHTEPLANRDSSVRCHLHLQLYLHFCLAQAVVCAANFQPVELAFRVQNGLRTILQEGTLQPRTQMLIQNFFSAVSYGVLDPESAKEKARLKQQEENRRLGFPDRPVHGLPPRIPVGLDLVDTNDARCAISALHCPPTLCTCSVGCCC